MSEISKLIFNELASRHAITLPEVGMLWVEFRGESENEAPMNTLMFSREIDHNALSVLDIIESKGSVESESVEQSYSSWLANHTSEGGVEIDGVGRIFESKITPSKELLELLNPTDMDEYGNEDNGDERGESRYSRIWIVLIVLFILILAGGWGWWWYQKSKAEVVKPKVEVVEDVIQEGDSTLLANAAEAERITQLAKKSTLYHVLGGVFSIEANANRYVAKMKKTHPEYECEIRAYRGERFAVSLFSSVDERGAVNARNRIVRELGDEEIWVYRGE